MKKSFEKHEAEHKPEHKPEMEKIESRLTILDHDAPIRDDIYKRTMQIIERASLARTYADAKYELPAKNPDLQPHAIYSQALTIFTDAEQLQDPFNRQTFLLTAISNITYCKAFIQPPSELEEKIAIATTRAKELLRQE